MNRFQLNLVNPFVTLTLIFVLNIKIFNRPDQGSIVAKAIFHRHLGLADLEYKECLIY